MEQQTKGKEQEVQRLKQKTRALATIAMRPDTLPETVKKKKGRELTKAKVKAKVMGERAINSIGPINRNGDKCTQVHLRHSGNRGIRREDQVVKLLGIKTCSRSSQDSSSSNFSKVRETRFSRSCKTQVVS